MDSESIAARTTFRTPAAGLRVFALALLLFVLLAASERTGAVPVASLYTVQVAIDSNRPDARNDAYTEALARILVRITGSRDALRPDEIEAQFPDAARYVLQFRPGEDDTLWVTLDGAAIERVLESAGHTVWGSDRPLTLVWLAVDWGQGEREIVAADDAQRLPGDSRSIDRNRLLRERVQAVAAERGIPVAFPLLDVEDRENVTSSDIWGGFDERLEAASERYAASSILVGRIQAERSQRSRWSHHFGGEQREWSGEPEEVVHQLADTLAAQFAISGNQQPTEVPITVTGIDSVVAYGTVQAYLQNLALIEELSIVSITGDRIHYFARAHGGKERLRRALQFARHLEPLDAPLSADRSGDATDPDALTFRYRP
jgi:hypothetical protein